MKLFRVRQLVHKLKYNGKDCVGESLRALFPEFHSRYCDYAVLIVVGFVASETHISELEELVADDCDCGETGCINGRPRGDLGTDE